MSTRTVSHPTEVPGLPQLATNPANVQAVWYSLVLSSKVDVTQDKVLCLMHPHPLHLGVMDSQCRGRNVWYEHRLRGSVVEDGCYRPAVREAQDQNPQPETEPWPMEAKELVLLCVLFHLPAGSLGENLMEFFPRCI